MSIEKLLSRHDAFLKDAAGRQSRDKIDAKDLARPMADADERAAKLEARLKALEEEKQQEVARIDEIAGATRMELEGLRKRIAVDRKLLDQALGDARPDNPKMSVKAASVHSRAKKRSG